MREYVRLMNEFSAPGGKQQQTEKQSGSRENITLPTEFCYGKLLLGRQFCNNRYLHLRRRRRVGIRSKAEISHCNAMSEIHTHRGKESNTIPSAGERFRVDDPPPNEMQMREKMIWK